MSQTERILKDLACVLGVALMLLLLYDHYLIRNVCTTAPQACAGVVVVQPQPAPSAPVEKK